jgi:steroid 5-alpha reductase family enzyme
MMISLPVLFINSSAASPSVTTFDTTCLTAFSLGVLCEVVADVQKARWVKAGRQGGFCTVGLWSYSRHPKSRRHDPDPPWGPPLL